MSIVTATVTVSNPPAPAPAAGLRWTAIALLCVAPLAFAIVWTLWRMPFPLTEAVALFEDVARAPSPARFWIPDTSYYRPLFHTTLWSLWHLSAPLDTRLALIKLLHIAPMGLLVVGFVASLRPRTAVDAAAAVVATAIVMASPGFRDNLEIPLAYTAVGMVLALGVWQLAHGEQRRWWRSPAILALTVIAIGFKEQGLAIVPVVVIAWWTGAPGVSRRTVTMLVVATLAYIALRLLWPHRFVMFEQAVGLVYRQVEPAELTARFGTFPYPIFAYNALATMSNILFAEPGRGMFFIGGSIVRGHVRGWQLIHLLSSTCQTGLIVWSAREAWRARRTGPWSIEARTFVVTGVVVLACGALSFDYSRDRLGGMAVPFYALSAYYALRLAAARVRLATHRRALACAALVLLGVGWEVRAFGTADYTRFISLRNQVQWQTMQGDRRIEFADRPVYLGIMESMVAQGTAPGAPVPTAYPWWLRNIIGSTPSPFGLP